MTCAMPITTTFAFRVRELNRQGMPTEAIALRLRASDDDVRWAHEVLRVLPVGDIEPITNADARRARGRA